MNVPVKSNLLGMLSFGRSVGKEGDVDGADVVLPIQLVVSSRANMPISIEPNICLISVTQIMK